MIPIQRAHAETEFADELAALARTLERRAASFVVRQSTLEDVFEAVASLAGFVYEEVAVPDDDDDRGGVDGVGRNDVASGDATTRKSTAAASFVPPIVSPAAAAAAAAAADDELGTPSPYLASMAKNAKLQLAQRGANVCQMITPVLMIVTLVIIEALLYNQVRRRRLRDAGGERHVVRRQRAGRAAGLIGVEKVLRPTATTRALGHAPLHSDQHAGSRHTCAHTCESS